VNKTWPLRERDEVRGGVGHGRPQVYRSESIFRVSQLGLNSSIPHELVYIFLM